MKWSELQEKHQQEWDEFSIRKDLAWQRVKKDNEAILTAFGGKLSEVPENTITVMEARGEKWTKEWGSGGEQQKLLEASQLRERKDFLKTARREFISHAKKSIERQREKERESKRKSKDHEQEP